MTASHRALHLAKRTQTQRLPLPGHIYVAFQKSEKEVSSCWRVGGGGELTTEGHKGTFWGDSNALYFDYCGDYTTIYLC